MIKEFKIPKIVIIPIINNIVVDNKAKELSEMLLDFLKENVKLPSGDEIDVFIRDDETPKDYDISIIITSKENFTKETIVAKKYTQKAIWCYDEKITDISLSDNQKNIYKYLHFPVFQLNSDEVPSDCIPKKTAIDVLAFIKSAMCIFLVKGKNTLNFGLTNREHLNTNENTAFFRDFLDMNTVDIDMSVIKKRIDNKIFNEEEAEKAFQWVLENINIRDISNEEKMKEDLKFAVEMTMVSRDLIIGNEELKALGYEEESVGYNGILSSFRESERITRFLTYGNFVETMLNSSFDWNGVRRPIIISTEAHSLDGVAMLLSYLLSGMSPNLVELKERFTRRNIKRKTSYDLTQELNSGLIHLRSQDTSSIDWVSFRDNEKNGCLKPYWEITKRDVRKSLENIELHYEAGSDNFRGGFYTVYETNAKMPITLSSIVLSKTYGPVMMILEGFAVTLPEDVHHKLSKSSDEHEASIWFSPILNRSNHFNSIYSIIAKWQSNYAAIAYEHIGLKLITLASMLRIPVIHHNLEEDRFLKPINWNQNKWENTDFYPCMHFGPLYQNKKK